MQLLRVGMFYPQRAFFIARLFCIRNNANMSKQYSLFSNLQRSSQHSMLARRRQRAFMQKIIVVLCAGVMSLLVISAIVDAQATQVIPVATRNIQQGSRVTANDVNYIRVPKHSVFRHTLYERVYSHNLLIATCDIQSGMPIFQNSVSRVPNIPQGFTAIAVHLASADHTLIPGEKIDLAFSKPIQDSAEDANASPKNSGSQRNKSNKNDDEFNETDTQGIDNRYVEIMHNAIVMRISKTQQPAQNQQNTTTLAMPAADALRLLQAQSANPSLAIVAMKHTNSQ